MEVLPTPDQSNRMNITRTHQTERMTPESVKVEMRNSLARTARLTCVTDNDNLDLFDLLISQ